MGLFGKKEYRISVTQDDWVTPEETLIDSLSSHSDLETPISPGVFRFILLVMGISSLVVLMVSMNMSVTQYQQFANLSLKNRTVNFSVPPPRGVITDRNGRPLVTNIPNHDVIVVSREFGRNMSIRQDAINRLAEILNTSPEELASAILAGVKKSAIFFVAASVADDQVAAIRGLNAKGVYVTTSARRQYVDGAQFSQVIGYVGRVNKDDLMTDPYYLSTDTVGRLGIEQSYEKALRGTHGKITFAKRDQESINEAPAPGNTVVLNIDYAVQKKLYNSFFEVLRESNLGGAAGIIQNPQTGAVLALVSFPDFDNNIFVDEVTQAEYTRLFESRSKPLFDRVISGLYNPGSTIKPFIGLAALEEKIITPKDTIQDCISITIPNPFKPDEPYVFKNWREDLGLFNLRRAIANSCNVFFYSVGGGFGKIVGLGAEKIVNYLSRGLANVRLGIDLPGEERGFIPSPDWKLENRGEPWYQGDTYNISIGQGDLLVTPLWLNSYISAIANGGTLYKPLVAQKIVDERTGVTQALAPQAIGQLPFSPLNISEVKSDMRETVLNGTAHVLQDVPVSVGAKTGTAEVIKGRRINALFTAFAPAENPEIAMTVLVEGSASNQGYALRVAHEVLKWYFEVYKYSQN